MLNKNLIQKLKWGIVISLVLVIKIISSKSLWVEQYYTYGVYPFISRLQRFLFGWLPFSIGDVLYALIIYYVLRKLIKFIISIKKKQISKSQIWPYTKRCVYFLLIIFIIFYGLWGLNYSRIGIAGQLNLSEQRYTKQDLDTLVNILHEKLNNNASLLTPAMRDSFKTKKSIFKNSYLAYQLAKKKYPFLKYEIKSIKPALFSYVGNYLGFQGYYNPFTGEAQVNTTIPQSVEPFVTLHEMAHQLGYAKESEANFVGFLACRLHPSVNFKYSVYFDMYQYAIQELAYFDSTKVQAYNNALHHQVKKDIVEYQNFYKKYSNPIEPYISEFYGYFLKVNNQPNGKASYNDVVTWLIAYYKKYGYAAI